MNANRETAKTRTRLRIVDCSPRRVNYLRIAAWESASRNPKSEIFTRRRCRRSERRGVLLLVVLSVLVLFMLIGTAFLMTSKQSKDQAKGIARVDRVGNDPDNRLDRGLRTLLRDTENPHSSARFHSLLRDLYGGDGFEAAVLRASPLPLPRVAALFERNLIVNFCPDC